MRPLRYLLPLLLLLAACDKTPALPGMKVGKPYQINGTTYYPSYDPTYDKIGMGSWYGPGFHGKRTANGEIFDQNALTAAHPTLPMPSMVRVTNIANGKSIIVRINDRGPFKKGRIIDLSKKSAQSIGMLSTMKVRVQYLPEETQAHLQSLQPPGTTFVMPEKYRNTGISKATEQSAPVSEVVSVDTMAQPPEAPPPVVAAAQGAPVVLDESTELEAKEEEAQQTPASFRPGPVQFTPPPLKPVNVKPKDEIIKVETKTSSVKYYVRVGTFGSKQNADAIGKKLGGAVATTKVENAGKVLWLVRSGPYDSKEAAEKALAKARASGAKDASVTK